jgi:hypothetical protein
VLRRDQRAHLGRSVGGVAHAHARRRVDHQLDEPIPGGPLDEDPGAGAAVLTRVVEDCVRRGGRSALEVGIGEHDVCGLAAELECHALDRLGRTAHHGDADLG